MPTPPPRFYGLSAAISIAALLSTGRRIAAALSQQSKFR
jgi:hypothetical protein